MGSVDDECRTRLQELSRGATPYGEEDERVERSEKYMQWEPRDKARIWAAPRPAISTVPPVTVFMPEESLLAAQPDPPWLIGAPDVSLPYGSDAEALTGAASASSLIRDAQALLVRAAREAQASEEATVAARHAAAALEAELELLRAQTFERERTFPGSSRAREHALEADLAAERERHAAVASELEEAHAAYSELRSKANVEQQNADVLAANEEMKVQLQELTRQVADRESVIAEHKLQIAEQKQRLRDCECSGQARKKGRFSTSIFEVGQHAAILHEAPHPVGISDANADFNMGEFRVDQVDADLHLSAEEERSVAEAQVLNDFHYTPASEGRSAAEAVSSCVDPSQDSQPRIAKAREEASDASDAAAAAAAECVQMPAIAGLNVFSNRPKVRPFADHCQPAAQLAISTTTKSPEAPLQSSRELKKCFSRSPSWHASCALERNSRRNPSGGGSGGDAVLVPVSSPRSSAQAGMGPPAVRASGLGVAVAVDAAATAAPMFREMVRGKQARQALQSFDCAQCKAFYDATGQCPGKCNGHGQVKNGITNASRHRFALAPTNTPEGFWDLSFPHPT